MKRLSQTIVLLFAITLTPVLRADVDPAQKEQIEKLLKLIGMEKLINQMMTQMLASIKQTIPDAPPDFWEKFAAKMNAHDLLDLLMPVYAKYYTPDDLRAIIAFYETPVGQKMITNMPLVMQEAMKVGQQWGQKMGEQALEEFKATNGAK